MNVMLFILFVATAVLYQLIVWVTHPLRKFPGPVSASFSNALYSWNFMSGRQPYRQLALHEKYGPVVRVAPDELSFNTASSWRDIYGTRKGVDTFVKSTFYHGGNFAAESLSIVSERDPKSHAEMRKYLSSAFSDRSMKAQEPIIAECIDRLVKKIGEAGHGKQAINLTMWYHLTTFDIIGSLAFGRDFGGIASGKEHFWVTIVTKSLRLGALADCFRRFPLPAVIFQTLFRGMINKLLVENRLHQKYTMDLVQDRLAKQSGRPDFLTKIIEARAVASISDSQIAAHSSDFVIAGSETTATALSCLTYYLLRDPDMHQRLQKEVRSAFECYEDIEMASVAPLRYLKAVCQEAMRIYPPVPFALPRLVPKGGATVDGHFLPGGVTVSTNPLAASLSAINFTDPWKFSPDRWLEPHSADDLEASQPFSCGTRVCMGRTLGWMELQTAMAKVIYKYDLELADPSLDWQRDARMHTLWENPALMVKVRPVRA